jgi:hypothetical protein
MLNNEIYQKGCYFRNYKFKSNSVIVSETKNLKPQAKCP